MAAADALRIAAGHQVVDGTDAEDELRALVGDLLEAAKRITGGPVTSPALAASHRRVVSLIG